MPKSTILYLDDDPLDRELLRLALRKVEADRLELICVGTLDEVREVLRTQAVDYFVTDNRLDLVTTFHDTLSELDDITIDAKIIVVSSETDSVLARDTDDLRNKPALVWDKCDFFSDLRKRGLALFEGK